MPDMSCNNHIISHHITSYHIILHHITSYYNTSITSHHITSNHITSHHITSHHITSHHPKRSRLSTHFSMRLNELNCIFFLEAKKYHANKLFMLFRNQGKVVLLLIVHKCLLNAWKYAIKQMKSS